MKTILVFTALLGYLLPGFSQEPQAKITGQILNEDKTAVQAASVDLLNNQNKIIKTNITSADGKFSFDKIAAGKYELEVSNTGYTKYTSAKNFRDFLTAVECIQ